jgi:signal peptidase I
MQNSLNEEYFIPVSLKEKGISRCFLYCGSSMSPTFRPSQLLYVRPQAGNIVPGDVIVFHNITSNNLTVHRVVSISPEGLITRGDNNRARDKSPVSQEHIIGRVEVFNDKGDFKHVAGGKRGAWSVRIRRNVRRIDRWLRSLFWNLYNIVRSSTPVRQFLHNRLHQYLKIIYLGSSDDPLIKTTYKGQTVALWQPNKNYFFCRKPYDFLIPYPDSKK